MSTPVTTEKWAGELECSICHRKRLMASEFSRKMMERHRAEPGLFLKCRQCVAQQTVAEQKSSQSSTCPLTSSGDETRACAACQNEYTADYFNKNQWNKGPGKSRCRDCVQKAVQQEESERQAKAANQLADAKEKVRLAKASGESMKILQAESELSAMEAETVTGLKPVKMTSGRGRRGGGGRRAGTSGRGRGRTNGRGR